MIVPPFERVMKEILISIIFLISVSNAIKFHYNETSELLIPQMEELVASGTEM